MSDHDDTNDTTQTWQPRRGIGFKIIAWLLLVLLAIGFGAMLIIAVT